MKKAKEQRDLMTRAFLYIKFVVKEDSLNKEVIAGKISENEKNKRIDLLLDKLSKLTNKEINDEMEEMLNKARN